MLPFFGALVGAARAARVGSSARRCRAGRSQPATPRSCGPRAAACRRRARRLGRRGAARRAGALAAFRRHAARVVGARRAQRADLVHWDARELMGVYILAEHACIFGRICMHVIGYACMSADYACMLSEYMHAYRKLACRQNPCV
eukprot:6192200-Pleurochrysis_carterae.AAC.3